ncbi:MAG: hypothetical protein ACREXT_08785 [Gammaproteobacteria bacterium]
MATRYMGIVGGYPQLTDSNVVGAAAGGTLAGGQSVQVVFDDAVFVTGGNLTDGKQRLLDALKLIYIRIQNAKTWPISSSS